MSTSSHRDLIVDQFTRQATPFSTASPIASEDALRLLVQACGAGPSDTVLDVACGGGLVVCAFAGVVRRAEGIDITPAMLERARALAAELDRTHPGAAASLREGMAETLTVLRLNIPPTLARTLRSTNAVESMISICRTHASNVKNWRDGQMALRWCAAGMVEAGKQFRRVNGHMHLRSLRDTLEKVTEPVGATGHTDTVTAA
jgi:SAM-dependent methyltransferase